MMGHYSVTRKYARHLACGVCVLGGLFNQLSIPAMAQVAEPTTRLERITVEDENARGPDAGIVAKKSATAAKTDTPLLETPQAVNVVTRDQMEAQGASSVSEALRYTPGVQAEANGYDVRYDWLWMRGFNTYGTMWLDGLVLPGDPQNYATPSIDPYTLERVEVIKGPASVLYGRTVPGGLVNLVSKRPRETTYREASVRTSAFGGIEGAVDMTGALTEDGTWLYRFTGLARNMHGQIDMERDRSLLVAPSITWNPSTDTSLTLYGYYQRDRDVFSPRFYPAAGTLLPNPAGPIPRDIFMADPNADSFNRDFYALGYEFSHRFNETWSMRQNLRYSRSEQDMFLALVNPAFAYAGAPSNELSRVSAVSDDSASAFAVDTQFEAEFATGALEHTALFGIDYVRGVSDTNFGNSAFGDPVPPPLDYTDPEYGVDVPVPAFQRSGLQTQNQIGFYLQDQVRYDRWVGTFGLRYDMSEIETVDRMGGTSATNNEDEKLTGRVGLAYLFDNGLAPYVSYSTGFLPLLGTDRHGDPFKAQTTRQFEVGVKYEPAGARGMVAVSYFDLTVENALTPDPTDPRPTRPSNYVQTGEQRVRGIEIEGKYELTPEIDILAAYAYSDSEVIRTNNPAALGREMERLPKHQGSLWVQYRPDLIPGLAVSAGVRATSSYQTDVTYLPELRIPSRALVDIGAEYDFGALNADYEGTKLRVNVTNLFDKRYVSHCLNITGGSCNYGAGRTITANLKYTW
ncbi:TonB-dependent siderophore receptor [uncultured Nitratireductor sp.]|uniref:TonB-dependent siderophore receptor n=1 Tax=uncultured Nitratireductor sp. TaxID=520953 RepID=UPI0025EDDA71|nr:TonB-dependent siderophore receptor [uncultured Nitratireductor sp.]